MCPAASDPALEAIALRLETGEFPPVLPAEINEVFRTKAIEALTWIKKDEVTRIQKNTIKLAFDNKLKYKLILINTHDSRTYVPWIKIFL